MEADVGEAARGVELNVEGGRVGLEGEAGRGEVALAGGICGGGREGELRADGEAGGRGDGGGPDGEAVRVAEVGTSRVGREGAVEVKLFAGVVLVDVGAEAVDLVGAVFDAVQAARAGMLGYADRVAEAPADEGPLAGVVVGLGAGEGGDVEGADLGNARGFLGGGVVDVVAAAAGDEEEVGMLLGEQEGAADVARVGHVLNENALVGEGPFVGVVVPPVDPLGVGCVQCLAVSGELNAVCELWLFC